MKKIFAVLLAVAMMLTATVASAASFPDMEDARWDWARDTVEELSEIGIVKGYSDGTYKPENVVTKQEAFTLFSRVIGVNDATNAQAVEAAQQLYANVAENYTTYAVKELCFMLYRGILTQNDLDAYLSEETKNEPMKRHEAAKLITKILNGEESIANAVMFDFDYTDATEFPNEATGYIYYVTENGIMSGMGDGTFSPDTGVTRAQIAIMLKRTMAKLDMTYVSGTVEAVSADAIVINGESLKLNEDVILHRDGAKVTAAAIETGDYAIVAKTYQGVLSVDAAMTEQSASNTKIVEGIYRGSFTDSRGTFVKIYDKEGGVNTTESYLLSSGTVTYTVNGEKRASLTAISETDYVYATLIGGKVVDIKAESKLKQVDEAVLTKITHEGKDNLLNITHKNAEYDETSWLISEDVIVKRNGKTAALTDLLTGDTINFTVTYGRVTEITAKSKTSTVKGTISVLHIEKDQPYITVKISDTKNQTLYLTLDTKIEIDGTLGTIYDLMLGYNVTITTESETATKISVTSVATTNSLTGTVTLVNEGKSFINISLLDSATNEIVTKQIFVTDKTSIRAGSNAAIVKLATLKDGDTIFATGVENIGTFEATTIIVINR